jgi:hypothetical protein
MCVRLKLETLSSNGKYTLNNKKANFIFKERNQSNKKIIMIYSPKLSDLTGNDPSYRRKPGTK